MNHTYIVKILIETSFNSGVGEIRQFKVIAEDNGSASSAAVNMNNNKYSDNGIVEEVTQID